MSRLSGRLPGRCAAVAATLALLQSCATLSEPVVRVGGEESGRTVELAVGQILEIRLQALPARGLAISLGSIVTPVLRPAGTPTFNDDTVPGGVAGTGTGSFEAWRFRAMQPGDVKVRMDYRLSWESTGPPTRSVTYEVSVR